MIAIFERKTSRTISLVQRRQCRIIHDQPFDHAEYEVDPLRKVEPNFVLSQGSDATLVVAVVQVRCEWIDGRNRSVSPRFSKEVIDAAAEPKPKQQPCDGGVEVERNEGDMIFQMRPNRCPASSTGQI